MPQQDLFQASAEPLELVLRVLWTPEKGDEAYTASVSTRETKRKAVVENVYEWPAGALHRLALFASSSVDAFVWGESIQAVHIAARSEHEQAKHYAMF